jgi:hypothetical protein
MKSGLQLNSVAVLLTDFVWNLGLWNTENRELLTNQPNNQNQRNQTQPNLNKSNQN